MKTALIAAYLAVSILWCSGATAHSCPAGTTLKRVPTSPAIRSQPYFPVSEEFCVRNSGQKTETRHGRYVLWGPNGEIQQEGNFVDGKKEGEWTYRLPSQTVVRTWSQDQYVDARVIASPAIFVIDFGACVPHAFGIPAGLGSTAYAVTGRKRAKCLLEYSIEIEMGVGPTNRCAVPVALGKVTISNTDMGLDFSPIAKYCSDK